MEQTILRRLEAYVESKSLIDKGHEGFRRFHSTANAVLRLTQYVKSGFIEDLSTAACFVDLEKSYDSVWREGLLYKLHRLGINGRMWDWIQEFLTNRTARCHVDEEEGNIFQTNIGLPQGSVIAPIQFNLYIVDMFQDTLSKWNYVDHWKRLCRAEITDM